MTVQINPVSSKDSGDMDALFKAIDIATRIYGAKLDREQASALQQLREKQETAKLAAERETLAGKQSFEKEMQDKELAFKANQAALDRAARAKTEVADKEKATKLPASTVGEIGDVRNVQNLITNLEKDYKNLASQAGSGVRSLLPGSAANKFNILIDQYVQSIGKPLEGGKMSDEDKNYYRRLMPKSTDTNAQAQTKIDGLRKMAAEKLNTQLQSLKDAGYKVDNFAPATILPSMPEAQSGTAIAAPAQKKPEEMSLQELEAYKQQLKQQMGIK